MVYSIPERECFSRKKIIGIGLSPTFIDQEKNHTVGLPTHSVVPNDKDCPSLKSSCYIDVIMANSRHVIFNLNM